MSSVKRIICLANSKKLGERCIAGIDITTGKWIRPVCDSLYPNDGRVPRSICLIDGKEPELLDILEVPVAENGNNFDFESENLSVLKGQWKVIGKSNIQDIINYYDNGLILHNSSKLVYPSFLKALPLDKRKTLQLINVVSLSINSRNTSKGGTQWLGTIVSSSGKRLVDIPITDSVFITKIESGYQPNGQYIITMSLGMPYKPDNWEGDEAPCWKLIAGVMEISGNKSQNELIPEVNYSSVSLYRLGTLFGRSPIIVTPDGQNLIALSNDRDLLVVKCWAISSYLQWHDNIYLANRPLYTKMLNANPYDHVFISLDGKKLGTFDLDKGEVTCWDVNNNSILYRFTDKQLSYIRTTFECDDEYIGIDDSDYEIFFSSDDKIIVCSYFGIKAWNKGKLSYSRSEYIYDMFNPICLSRFRNTVSFTKAQYDNNLEEVFIININNGELITCLGNSAYEKKSIGLSCNGDLLVSADCEGILRLYDVAKNIVIKSFPNLKGYQIWEVLINPNLKNIAVKSSKSGNEIARIWKGDKSEPLQEGDYSIKILDILTGKVVATIDKSSSAEIQLCRMTFSSDGKLLFVDSNLLPSSIQVFHLVYKQ